MFGIVSRIVFFLSLAGAACAGPWLQAGVGNDDLAWGIEGGIRFAIHPSSVDGNPAGGGGPRGLIRVGSPTLPGGRYDLVNFVSIEPTTMDGRLCQSELDRGGDGQPGIRMWIDRQPGQRSDPGLIRNLGQTQDLNVRIRVEKFPNGAHVNVVCSIDTARPDEIRFTVYAEPDSAPLKNVCLSATMGNRERVRHVVLANEVLNSLAVYPDFRGNGFAKPVDLPVDRLARAPNGDVIVPFTTDEAEPASRRTDPENWYWGGFKATQYWRKYAHDLERNLIARVNGRAEYWGTDRPIPGGVSFENVELRDDWVNGEQWVFGVSRLTPAELIHGVQFGAGSLLGVTALRP